jgi:quercetin dioxygenase-like cupin family protein
VIALDPRAAARSAVAASPTRPATAVVHDSPDARLVVFRIAPGQAVAPHTNPSTVQLLVLEGSGTLTGEAGGATVERPCAAGDLVLYAPYERHGMRAGDDTLVLLATITPRPGSR